MALTSYEQRARVVAKLIERRDALGGLKRSEVRSSAQAFGKSVPTVYRWIRNGAPAGGAKPPTYRLTDADVGLYFRYRGNAAAAHRALQAEASGPIPSIATYRRALNRELDSATRAAARAGLPGRDKHRMVLKHKPLHRNERWEGDHTQLEIHVLAPGRPQPVRPWITWMIDVGTRAITGWAISAENPTRGSVLAAIRSGVERRDETDLFHGVPGMFLWDNGLEFTANAVTEAAALLGSVAVTTPPYSPEKKPYIERLNRTLETELIAVLPHYIGGPRKRDGSLYEGADEMLSLAGLSHLVAKWIEHYNHERAHRSLQGKTPAQVWLADPTPIRPADPEDVRHFTLELRSSKIRRDGGVHFKNVAYVAPELYGHEGETVEIGVVPYDLSKIEVFRSGEWLCTATPTVELTDEQLARHREASKKANQRLQREMRRLRREQKARKERIAPMVANDLEPRLLPPYTEPLPSDDRRPDVFHFGDEIGDVE